MMVDIRPVAQPEQIGMKRYYIAATSDSMARFAQIRNGGGETLVIIARLLIGDMAFSVIWRCGHP